MFKGIQIKSSIFLFADDLILYIRDLKDYIRKLELIGTFRKVVGYKVNKQVLVPLALHTNNPTKGSERSLQGKIKMLKN